MPLQQPDRWTEAGAGPKRRWESRFWGHSPSRVR